MTAVRPSGGTSSSPRELTRRQQEVLTGIANGHNRQEIAATLFVCESTVAYHLAELRARLRARNSAHLVHLAHQNGLLR